MGKVDMRKFYSVLRSEMVCGLDKCDLILQGLRGEYQALQDMPKYFHDSDRSVLARAKELNKKLSCIMSEEDRKRISLHLKIMASVISDIEFEGMLTQLDEMFKEISERNRERYVHFSGLREHIQKDFVGAFSASSITKPIKSIRDFYEFLIWKCPLDGSVVARAIGLVIKYNVAYSKKHGDAKIDDIDILNKLDEFINEFGSRIKFDASDLDALEDEFINLLYCLLSGDKSADDSFRKDKNEAMQMIIQVAKLGADMALNRSLDNMYVREADDSGKTVINESPTVKSSPVVGDKISDEEIKFRSELNKCYKNGEVICFPDLVLVDFENLVLHFLEAKEASYVIGKLKNKYKKMPVIRYMTPADRDVYIKAISEKAKLGEEQMSEFDRLMQYLNELAEVYKAGIRDEDKGEYDKELEDCVGNIELLFKRCGVALRSNIDSKKVK